MALPGAASRAVAQAPSAAENPPAARTDATVAQPLEAQKSAPRAERAAPPAAKRLPADVRSTHTITLADRSLTFQAIAGSLPINDGEGKLQAEIAFTAFLADAAGDARRPVSFVVNGGPGAASAYLNLGAMGPWRLALEALTPSTIAPTQPNAETWLDFTDLVFIDPAGAGYSRLASDSEKLRRDFWSVEGDAEALAVFMRKWITAFGRARSPVFIVGESYGGFRAPLVAEQLREKQNVGVRGLIMISPVLDFGWRGGGRHVPLAFVSRLPSMAAAAREQREKFDRAALREVEDYAVGEYLRDLMRGEGDAAAVARISARVAAYTGLDFALVRRLAGRIDMRTFQRELRRSDGLVASAYDASVTGLDPEPNAARSRFSDPFLSAIHAPLANAAVAQYRDKLGWRTEERYHLLNNAVSSQWVWGRGRTAPQVVDELRGLLAADSSSRVLVAHGASDLVTPYFESQLIIDQLPAYGAADRLRLAVYGGGHMFYSREASRRALREDARSLMRATLAAH
ncbi:MAG: peptidase S10 [Proteobacteria bacterium]|nr:peptidase S10 [Pseudomonadota bacterium]